MSTEQPELPPQSELEQLLVAAAGSPEDEAAGRAFVSALLDGQLGVPGRATEGGFSPEVGEQGGRRFAVAFTHHARLERFLRTTGLDGSGLHTVGLLGRELFAHLVEANLSLLLNAGNGYGKEFTAPEMSDLLAGVAPGSRERVVPTATTLQVGEPAHVPAGLVDRLRAHIARVGGVDSAALAWVRYPDGLEGYLLEVAGPVQREDFLPGIDAAVGDLGERTLDVVVSGAARKATGRVPAFWP